MRGSARFVCLAAALFVFAGCTGESALPEATGKGTVRAINAAPGSPPIRFLIEERLLDTLLYKTGSTGRRWDDFEYNFNFEAQFPGDSAPTRIVSEAVKIDADRDYTFVVTGSVTAPSVLLWDRDTRSFAEGETVFDARFAHLAPSLGDLDVYFDAPGIAPVLGMARGTVAYGEILQPLDFEAGEYVLTATIAGDPSDVVYQSRTVTYAAQISSIVTLLDGDELDVAPRTARSFTSAGGTIVMPDARFMPTVRLFQASSDLAVADVYTDEMLTDQLVTGHAFGDITGDLPIPIGDISLRYTPAGDTGAILFEGALQAIAGNHANFIVVGNGTERQPVSFNPDRRSITTIARISAFNAAANHEILDFYAVEAGTSVDDANRTSVLSFAIPSPMIALNPGSYDLYVTVLDEKTIVGGPVSIDVALGDVVETMIFDVTDPSAAEIRIVPAP